jgi:hypothetical protein
MMGWFVPPIVLPLAFTLAIVLYACFLYFR